MNRQTYSAKNEEVKKNWVEIDAKDQILGRLSTQIATILMGKNKATYTPHCDVGDFVVVVNADKIKLTGKKLDQKFHETYSGHPSGRKVKSFRQVLEDSPENLVYHSVRRMLSKNKLADKQLKKLKVYAGAEHPHQAQFHQAESV